MPQYSFASDDCPKYNSAGKIVRFSAGMRADRYRTDSSDRQGKHGNMIDITIQIGYTLYETIQNGYRR